MRGGGRIGRDVAVRVHEEPQQVTIPGELQHERRRRDLRVAEALDRLLCNAEIDGRGVRFAKNSTRLPCTPRSFTAACSAAISLPDEALGLDRRVGDFARRGQATPCEPSVELITSYSVGTGPAQAQP